MSKKPADWWTTPKAESAVALTPVLPIVFSQPIPPPAAPHENGTQIPSAVEWSLVSDRLLVQGCRVHGSVVERWPPEVIGQLRTEGTRSDGADISLVDIQQRLVHLVDLIKQKLQLS